MYKWRYPKNATVTKLSFPEVQTKRRDEETNAKHETTDTQTKKSCNTGNSLKRPVENLLGALLFPR